MNKIIGIVGVFLASALVLASLPVVFFRVMFPIPEQMTDKAVCFLAPELTWSDKMSDVTKCFGAPLEKGDYDDITGTKTNTYETEYKNYTMQVEATRHIYPHSDNVFEYYFRIQCADGNESQKLFTEFYNEIIENNSNDEFFSYEKVDEHGVSFSIDYGATGIYYELYQTYQFEIVLIAYCQY